MISINNKEPQIYYGSTPIKEVYKGSTKIYPSIDVLSIMDSMILWYDLKRQGATNESMAENPILKDLSGNGHDATCYNFAWSEMSGVGGYGSDFSIPFKSAGTGEITQTNNKIEIHSWTSESAKILAFQGNSWKISPGTKIRIHGLSNKYRLTLIALIDRTWNNLIYGTKSESPYVTEDGEYTTLEEIDTSIANTIQLKIYIIDDNVNTFKNIVIEQLPLYPNALVSDGVDDYCLAEGLPLLNKEDGYTVIAKRKLFNKESGITFCKTNDSVLSEGAFSIENGINTASFGGMTSILSHLTEDGTIYQTSRNYNDKTINIGDISDTNFLFIAYSGNTSRQYKNIALYSLLLFDRDLTEQEIEWVKKNMVEGDYEITT